jgi:hypothetical protein
MPWTMRKRTPDDSATVPNARPFVESEPEPAAEDVFASFLKNAYARKEGRPSRVSTTQEWERSVEELLPREPEPRDERDTEPPPRPSTVPDADSTLRVVPLTKKKSLPPTASPSSPPPLPVRATIDESSVSTAVANAEELRAAVRASRPEPKPKEAAEQEEWSSVVPPPSEATQRREAKKLVPDLATKKPKPKPAREASEDGLIPSGELDRKLEDMAVLLRYGHEPQVARELEGLRRNYPQDLLLLRRIGEFWTDCGRIERALEILFALASGLFERRNVEGMRQALEQAKALDPNSERANRLLALLDSRP